MIKYTKQGVRDLDVMYPIKKNKQIYPDRNCDHRYMRKRPACESCVKRGLKWCGIYECSCGFWHDSWEPDCFCGY